MDLLEAKWNANDLRWAQGQGAHALGDEFDFDAFSKQHGVQDVP